MADKRTYDVKRQHLGDKLYAEGDERELDPNEAERLVQLGVLEESKAESKTATKARKGAPENK